MVGPNGAGKSTILKIMAGLDTPSNGEAKLSPGYTVGILMQEPELDETKTVLENVQEGVGPIKAQARPLQRDLGSRWPTPTPTSTPCSPRWARCRRRSTPPTRWDLDSQLEQAMDALRTPPGDAERHEPLRW